jgi:hypothetical protein
MEYLYGSLGVKKKPKDELDPYSHSIYSASFPYGGQLIWDDPIPPAKTNISFIPYITANTSTDREADPVEQILVFRRASTLK